MKTKLFIICALILLTSFSPIFARQYFDKSKDLLLANFDLKPDKDDVQAAAALCCMLKHPDLSGVNYYAVAGAYGTQGGTFISTAVPGYYNSLFGAENEKWTNANSNWNASVTRVRDIVKAILDVGGKVFIQEAGESNFTYDMLQAVSSAGVSLTTIKAMVIVVQHSDYNENNTTASKLSWVKSNTDYNRIADGNISSNGTPGYVSTITTYMDRAKASTNPNTYAKSYWTLADDICDNFAASWENPTIKAGGVDYSDCAEIWWIFDIGTNADTVEKFWNRYVVNTPTTNTDVLIPKTSNKVEMTIYPSNPISCSEITLKFKNTNNQQVNISVVDLQGKAIFHNTIFVDYLTIPASILSRSGVYLIKMNCMSEDLTQKLLLR